jgi:hypothetical protein
MQTFLLPLVTQVTTWIALAVTGLVVTGGTKQLHDLLTNMSKASDQKSTPQQTGGSAGEIM